MLWWQKMGKVVNRVKLTIPSQYEPHFGGKDGKTCKMTKIGCFEPIEATFFFFEKFAIVGHFEPLRCETIQKVEKLKRFADVPPSGNENLEIWQKLLQ